MIITLKKDASAAETRKIVSQIEEKGLSVTVIEGANYNVYGVVGDTTVLDEKVIAANPAVDHVQRVAAPYKKANRIFHPADSVIDVAGIKVGGQEDIVVIGGPCSVETRGTLFEIAGDVKDAGAKMFRGGAYKPRTSPYAFQGLKLEGLALLEQAKELTGMPICTEIMSPKLVEEFDRRVDVIQVGARNMQNFDLLTELGQTHKPILLKRGLSATINEWLMSAEYIMAAGNPNVILCERGIRTFETYTRNTLDLSAVQAVKRLSHLPVIVDPSHATGLNWMVERMSLAAIAAGADGLIIEVHNNPPKALCDGAQSLTPDQYAQLVGKISALAPIVERTL